jgi:dihydrofolate reductase
MCDGNLAMANVLEYDNDYLESIFENKLMKRSEIIDNYKAFFGLEDMPLGENDNLMIAWAENLLADVKKDRGVMILGDHMDYEALKRTIEILDIQKEDGKGIAIVGSRQVYSKAIELAQDEAHRAFKESKPEVMELLPRLIEPTVYDLERPSKRENKNKKGRNSHRYGRRPSKF